MKSMYLFSNFFFYFEKLLNEFNVWVVTVESFSQDILGIFLCENVFRTFNYKWVKFQERWLSVYPRLKDETRKILWTYFDAALWSLEKHRTEHNSKTWTIFWKYRGSEVSITH